MRGLEVEISFTQVQSTALPPTWPCPQGNVACALYNQSNGMRTVFVFLEDSRVYPYIGSSQHIAASVCLLYHECSCVSESLSSWKYSDRERKAIVSLEESSAYCQAYLLVSSLLFPDWSINSLALLISSLSFDLGNQHLISSNLLSTRSGVLLTC